MKAKKWSYRRRVKETSVNGRTGSFLLIKSLCEIQEVPLAAVEGVRIDYGDEDKD